MVALDCGGDTAQVLEYMELPLPRKAQTGTGCEWKRSERQAFRRQACPTRGFELFLDVDPIVGGRSKKIAIDACKVTVDAFITDGLLDSFDSFGVALSREARAFP